MRLPTRHAKNLVLIILMLIYLVLLIHSYAQAGTKVTEDNTKHKATPSSSLKVDIIAEGKAPVSEDEEEAKNTAIEHAKDVAILKTAGHFVNSEILQKERIVLLKIFASRRDEIIEDIRILSDQKTDDDFYRIKAAIKVRKDLVEDALMKNLFDDRVIVIASEKNSKKAHTHYIFEKELVRRIKGKGYTVIDSSTMKNKATNSLIASARQGNHESLRRLGIYCLADVIVVGSVEASFSEKTQDIYSSRGKGLVRIYRIGDKKEIVSVSRHGVKGFGSDEAKSGVDAIRRISPMLADEAIKGLPPKPLRKVKVFIKEIENHASLDKAKRMLADMPYIREIKNGIADIKGEKATLYIKTTKSIDYIVREIAELKRFVVTNVKESVIFLEARRIN
ncbi:MAG: hypothetical protein C0392_10210 [Syntrophus sp. (in: bacteria)]|nr:hypothetical protein [Syntrophus sp. (in: bacteria)]